MFNFFKTKEEILEKIEDDHNFKIEKNKLKRKLKENNKDESIIFSGKFLSLWGTIATIVSTLLTIAGLYKYFSSSLFSSISFISAIVLTQFTVYILAKNDTSIKKNFKQHIFKCSMLKFILFILSVYGNFTFFTQYRESTFITIITTLAMCICIDIIAIYTISIAKDMKTLNKNENADKIYKGLIGKVLYNFTFNFIDKINKEYEKNTKIANVKVIDLDSKKSNLKVVQYNDKVKEIDFQKDSEIKYSGIIVSNNDIELVKKTIIDNANNGIAPSVNNLIELTGLSRIKVITCKKELEKDGVIETIGNRTILREA